MDITHQNNCENGSPESDDEFDRLVVAYHDALLLGESTAILLDEAESLDVDSQNELRLAHRVLRGLVKARDVFPRRPKLDNVCAPLGGSAGGASPARPVRRLGRFELVRKLGRGGMGVVFLAYDPVLKRRVALKVPRPEALVAAETHARFDREALAAGRLTHPNLIAVHEVGTVGPICFIASAFCDGPNLAQWIAARTSCVPARMAADILAQSADGIDYAHQQGVLHRDLKPSNVLLASRGQIAAETAAEPVPDLEFPFTPKITDFGLAHVEDLTECETRTGVVMGTPSYMAPEQADGRTRDIGPATDVYGLGAILYELLTRRPAFLGEGDAARLRQVVFDEPKPPRSLRPDIPRDLEAICLKCLEKDPSKRYVRASELAADLRRFLAGEPTVARPLGITDRLWKWTRRQPTVAALVAVSVTATALLVASLTFYSVNVTAAYRLAEQHRRAAELGRQEADAQRREAVAQHQEAESSRSQAQALVRDLRHEVYVKDMGRVQQIWQQGDAPRALALLEKYRSDPPQDDLRGFEWYFLYARAKDQGRTLFGHIGAIHHVAASPNGRLLATAGEDRKIQLWNTRTWKVSATLRAHKRRVNWVAFAPDGTRLASASADGTVRLWNLSSAAARRLATFDQEVVAVVYLPDGQTVVAATKGGRIALLDTESGAKRCEFDRPGQVKSLAVAPDGKEMAITFDSTPAERWDLTKTPPEMLGELRPRKFAPYSIVQYSPDGQTLVVGEEPGMLKFLRRDHPSQGQVLGHLATNGWNALAIAPDGRRLAAAGDQGGIQIVDMNERQARQPFVGHRGRIDSITWLPDGETLVSASADGSAKIWHATASQAGEAIYELPLPARNSENCAHTLKFSGDGRQLWFNTSEGVWSIDLATKQATRRFTPDPSTGGLYGVAYTLQPSRPRILVCSESGLRQVWDATTERVVFSIPIEAGDLPRLRETCGRVPAYLADLSADGRHVVAPDPKGEISIWNVESGREALRLSKKYANPVLHSGFSPDARLVAVAHLGGVDLFDAATGAPLAAYNNSPPPAFSPDGRFFLQEISGRYESFRFVRVDQLRTSQRELQLPRMTEHVLAISHDGKTFATFVGADSTHGLRLWNTETGQPMFALTHNRQDKNFIAAAFSADDTMLAALVSHEERFQVLLWRACECDSALHLPLADSGNQKRSARAE